jgi:hypothetical protein
MRGDGRLALQVIFSAPRAALPQDSPSNLWDSIIVPLPQEQAVISSLATCVKDDCSESRESVRLGS